MKMATKNSSNSTTGYDTRAELADLVKRRAEIAVSNKKLVECDRI